MSKLPIETRVEHPGRVLVVDPDPQARAECARALRARGHHVSEASGAEEALWWVDTTIDVVFAEEFSECTSAFKFLESARIRAPFVPVVITTSRPSVESAVRALHEGAAGYLQKPLSPEALSSAVRRALGLRHPPAAPRETMERIDRVFRWRDEERLRRQFDRAMHTLWPAFQPIVSLKERRVVAYEALLRTDEPSMARPDDVLRAAERLDRIREVGRTMRDRVAAATESLPAGTLLFVNLHPSDLADPELTDPASPLAALSNRVILEVTERAALEGNSCLDDCLHRIRDLGYRLAVDDLGAGYAGLTSLVLLRPEYVKLDISLVSDVSANAAKRRIVKAVLELCDKLGMETICEGVETEAERDTLANVGADLMQGYHFGRPDVAFLPVNVGHMAGEPWSGRTGLKDSGTEPMGGT